MDLKAVGNVDNDGSARATTMQGLMDLLENIDNSSEVVIAAVNGPAFGGGVGLAFACDLRICAKSASFTLSEVRLGLCPAVISKYVVREWGFAFSREAMLTSRTVTAAELKSIGTVIAATRAEGDDTEGNVDDLLSSLRSASPSGSRMSKELVRLGWVKGGHIEQRQRVIALFDEMMRPSSEGAHGIEEFVGRRKVDWDAQNLANFLVDAADAGCHRASSFYAYAVSVAGSVLILHLCNMKDEQSERYQELEASLQNVLGILDDMSEYWSHASKMVRQ